MLTGANAGKPLTANSPLAVSVRVEHFVIRYLAIETT